MCRHLERLNRRLTVAVVAVVVSASLGGCGGGSHEARAGVDPRILAETIARDLKRQNGGDVVVRCRQRAARTYECISAADPSGLDPSESGDQQSGVIAVTVMDDGAYRGDASGVGQLVGFYPRDVSYRGLDLVALMRAVNKRGQQQGEIPVGYKPIEPCEVGLRQDRSYECYIQSRTRGNAGGTHTILVTADGQFSVDEEGDALSGQLPASLRSPHNHADRQPGDVVKIFQRAVANRDGLEACSVATEEAFGSECESDVNSTALSPQQRQILLLAPIRNLRIVGNRATLLLGQESLELTKVDGEWKISSSKTLGA